MSDQLIMDFPVLQESSGDFVEGVAYEVSAKHVARQLIVTHVLKGTSFIGRLMVEGVACFAARLLYRDSSERQHHLYEGDYTFDDDDIIAQQTISNAFSYGPEISPSIIVLKDQQVTVDSASGLNDFWRTGDRFSIDKFARIAIAPKLNFTSGNESKLMRIISDEKNLAVGEMKVEVIETAGESETPVTLYCGKDVYDQLYLANQATPTTEAEAIQSAIVTQALCATYAYLNGLQDKDAIESGVLRAHLEELEEKTGMGWLDENFNPSLAATKMRPYCVNMLNPGGDND